MRAKNSLGSAIAKGRLETAHGAGRVFGFLIPLLHNVDIRFIQRM